MGRKREVIDPWAQSGPPPKKPKYRPKRGLAKYFARLAFGYRPAHATYALIAAAGHVDDQYTPDERLEVLALTRRMKSMRELPQSRKDRFIRTVLADFKAGKLRKVVEKALWSLPPDRAESVFMHVCDVVLADRFNAPAETAYVKQVAEGLGLDADRAMELAQAIKEKNQF